METIKIRDLSNNEVKELAWAIDHYGDPADFFIGNSDWEKAALILGKSVCLNYEVKPDNDNLEPADYIERLVDARYGLEYRSSITRGVYIYHVSSDSYCKQLAGCTYIIHKDEATETGELFIFDSDSKNYEDRYGWRVTIENVLTGKRAAFLLAEEYNFGETWHESLMSMIAEMELGDAFRLEDFTSCREGYLDASIKELGNHRLDN